MDILMNLGMMEDYIKFARESINKESEGNLKYALGQIEALATVTNNEVKGW